MKQIIILSAIIILAIGFYAKDKPPITRDEVSPVHLGGRAISPETYEEISKATRWDSRESDLAKDVYLKEDPRSQVASDIRKHLIRKDLFSQSDLKTFVEITSKERERCNFELTNVGASGNFVDDIIEQSKQHLQLIEKNKGLCR